MPVRWSADLDKLFLLKILDTHSMSPDLQTVADTWPTGHGEIPTKRALQERWNKLRKDAKGFQNSAQNDAEAGSKKLSNKVASSPASTTPPQLSKKRKSVSERVPDVAPKAPKTPKQTKKQHSSLQAERSRSPSEVPYVPNRDATGGVNEELMDEDVV